MIKEIKKKNNRKIKDCLTEISKQKPFHQGDDHFLPRYTSFFK